MVIDVWSIIERVSEDMCADCPNMYREHDINNWDCPAGMDICDKACIRQGKALRILDIIDRANSEIAAELL